MTMHENNLYVKVSTAVDRFILSSYEHEKMLMRSFINVRIIESKFSL